LTRCPGPDWFEDCFSTILADQQSAYELEVGAVSDLAIGRSLADSAEDLAIETLHDTM